MVFHVAMIKTPGTLTTTEVASARPKAAAYGGLAAPSTEASQQPASAEQDVLLIEPQVLARAVNDLTQNMQNLQRSLEFTVDESSGRTVVTVIDKETQKVIRQIPQKDILALASRIEKAAGMLVHEEA